MLIPGLGGAGLDLVGLCGGTLVGEDVAIGSTGNSLLVSSREKLVVDFTEVKSCWKREEAKFGSPQLQHIHEVLVFSRAW